MYATESSEMYLESILVLKQTKGGVRAIDVSHYTGYSKPSVSRAMTLLRRDGHITVDDGGLISLTPSGQAIAENILDRHRTLSSFLVSIGVDPETAAEDACKMEHDLSDATFCAIKRMLQK